MDRSIIRSLILAIGIWPLHLVGADNDLAAAHAKLARSVAGVREFLTRHGIDTSQVQISGFSVADASTNQYSPERSTSSRYVIRETMIIRSSHPDGVLAASQQIGELAAIGVVISSGNGGEFGGVGTGPTFVFSGLNGLKPPMIAEATARAREACEPGRVRDPATRPSTRHRGRKPDRQGRARRLDG